MNIPGAFADVDVRFNRRTEKALALTATAGYQKVMLGPIPPTGGTATHLVGGTTYTATAKIDGSNRAISILGSTAQTFTTLLAEINSDISTWATATLTTEGILITSLTTGSASSVVLTDTTLFAGLTRHFQAFGPSVKGESLYLRWSLLDNDSRLAVKTVMDLVDTGATAWTPGSDGFSVSGATAGAVVATTAGSYDINVNLAGAGAVDVVFQVTTGMTYQQMLDDQISPALVALGLACTVSMVGDTVRFTSTSYGTSSTVVLTAGTNADIMAALSATNIANTTAGYQIVNVGGAKVGGSATGLANDTTAYTATITVDGVGKSISVVGSAAQTFTTLITEINTDLGASATAALVNGNIKVTSATTGLLSTVAIVDTGGNHLFSTLTGYVAILTAVAGTSTAGVDGSSSLSFPVTYSAHAYADWKAVLMGVKGPNGFGPFFVCPNKALIDKGPKPAARGDAVETAVYFDGSNWKYFSNDVTLAANSVNPPEM